MGGPYSTTETNQTVAPWAPQGDALQMMINQSRKAFRESDGVAKYTGDFVKSATPEQRALMANSQNYTAGTAQDGVTNLFNAGGASMYGGLTNALNATTGLTNYGNTNQTANTLANANAYSNPALVQSQFDSAMRGANNNYLENVMPGITANAASGGNAFNTNTAVQRAIAQRGLNDTAASTYSNLLNNDWTQALGMANNASSNQLNALSGAASAGSNLLGQGMNGVNSGVTANATNQNSLSNAIQNLVGYQQADAQNAISKNNYLKTEPFMSLNMLNNIINGRSMGSQTNGTSTTTTDPGMMSMLGGGISGLGAIKSDREAKHKITEIGVGHNGLKIYSFEYRNDPTGRLHIGFMAQDVAAIDPASVARINGVMHIKRTFIERD